MKQHKIVTILALLLATISWTRMIPAQALPTASQPLQLSAFGAVSGVFTGLAGGKNFSITAGADLALPPWHGVRPAIEVRGTYPTDHGLVDSEKSVLGGLKVETLLEHRFRPYGDFLFGRGQTNFGSFGYMFNRKDYAVTTTYVYSPGAGFDYTLSNHLAIKVDGQYQRWGGGAQSTPSEPTPSNTVYSKVGTVGIVYRFGSASRPRY